MPHGSYSLRATFKWSCRFWFLSSRSHPRPHTSFLRLWRAPWWTPCGHCGLPRLWMRSWRSLRSPLSAFSTSSLQMWWDPLNILPSRSLSRSVGSASLLLLPALQPSTCRRLQDYLLRCIQRKSWTRPRPDTAPFCWLQDARRRKYHGSQFELLSPRCSWCHGKHQEQLARKYR